MSSAKIWDLLGCGALFSILSSDPSLSVSVTSVLRRVIGLGGSPNSGFASVVSIYVWPFEVELFIQFWIWGLGLVIENHL